MDSSGFTAAAAAREFRTKIYRFAEFALCRFCQANPEKSAFANARHNAPAEIVAIAIIAEARIIASPSGDGKRYLYQFALAGETP